MQQGQISSDAYAISVGSDLFVVAKGFPILLSAGKLSPALIVFLTQPELDYTVTKPSHSGIVLKLSDNFNF